VIEDEAVLLAVGGAQAAADHLHEQHFGLGRARQDDAADIPVDAGGEAANIADHLDVAVGKTLGDDLTLGGVGIGVDVLGDDTARDELLLQILGMQAIDREA
jgi:hypothetical protein